MFEGRGWKTYKGHQLNAVGHAESHDTFHPGGHFLTFPPLELTLSRFVHHRGIQEGESAVSFRTLGHLRGPSAWMSRWKKRGEAGCFREASIPRQSDRVESEFKALLLSAPELDWRRLISVTSSESHRFAMINSSPPSVTQATSS